VRKIKEVLRLKFDVGLGLRAIARSCSIGLGTAQSICSGPRLLRSRGRWDLSGTMTGLRPRCSVARHAVARPYYPCPISPILIVSGSNTDI
jgi:hypothetical protein